MDLVLMLLWILWWKWGGISSAVKMRCFLCLWSSICYGKLLFPNGNGHSSFSLIRGKMWLIGPFRKKGALCAFLSSSLPLFFHIVMFICSCYFICMLCVLHVVLCFAAFSAPSLEVNVVKGLVCPCKEKGLKQVQPFEIIKKCFQKFLKLWTQERDTR